MHACMHNTLSYASTWPFDAMLKDTFRIAHSVISHCMLLLLVSLSVMKKSELALRTPDVCAALFRPSLMHPTLWSLDSSCIPPNRRCAAQCGGQHHGWCRLACPGHRPCPYRLFAGRCALYAPTENTSERIIVPRPRIDRFSRAQWRRISCRSFTVKANDREGIAKCK